MADIQYHQIRPFTFADGTTVPSLTVAYLDINPTAAKTALVLTFFRGRLQNTCTFAEGSLRDHRVIVAALLGNGESASPSNTAGFPAQTADYVDCVAAQRHLLQALGVHELDLVIGFSMGGQAAYYWALLHGKTMVRRAAVICSAARTSGHNRQFLEGPKTGLLHGRDYSGGSGDGNVQTMNTSPLAFRAFGKAYSAWLTSAAWFEQEKYRELGFTSQEAWDEKTTGANYVGWAADDLLAMVDMWQRGDLSRAESTAAGKKGEASGSLEETLGRIQTPVLLMPCRTDQYFRWEASEREAQALPNATLKVIPSVWGHMAGSGINPVDTAWMDEQIRDFLAA